MTIFVWSFDLPRLACSAVAHNTRFQSSTLPLSLQLIHRPRTLNSFRAKRFAVDNGMNQWADSIVFLNKLIGKIVNFRFVTQLQRST